jgi:mxaA protein
LARAFAFAMTMMLVTLATIAPPAHAQIWSTDRTEEAAAARAREERERRARERGETVPARPREAPESPPRAYPSAPSMPAAPGERAPTSTAPNTSFTAPAATPTTARPGTDASTPKPAGASTGLRTGLPSTIEPRDFGLTLGDVIHQLVALPAGTPAFEQLDVDLRQGRIGTWVERRGARRVVDVHGQDWLVIEHQVTNVAAAPRQGELPVQSLGLPGGARLEIAPVGLGLAPVAAANANVADALRALRPDHEPPMPDERTALRRLRASAWVLGVLLLGGLLAWRWREWRDARRKPFAKAVRTLEHAPQAAPEAWVAMHRALNEAAGRTVHAGSIDALYARAPALRSEHAALARFFAASNARFFAPPRLDGPAVAPATPDANATTHVDLLDLARRLRRLEKSAEA